MALEQTTDEYLMTSWRLPARGQVVMETPRHVMNKDKACGDIFDRRLCQSQLIANRGLVTRAAVATAAATAAIFARFGFVDVQRSSAQVLAVELLDSSSAFFLR